MKKILFILALLISFSAIAQTGGGGKNEVHLNALNVIAFKWIDLSYERVINDESSFGVSFSKGFADEPTYIFSYSRDYAITPYYRYYISQENTSGIFGEAFTMINGGDVEDEMTETVSETNPQTYTDYSDFAFGLGGGYKHVSKMGLTLQGYGGVGRNLFDEKAPVVVLRLGVTIGYRF